MLETVEQLLTIWSPPRQAVSYHFRRWQKRGVLAQIRDTLVEQVRAQASQETPKYLAVDSQRVPSTKGGAREYDGSKKVKGRKRHIVEDSQGSVLEGWVAPADGSDARGARGVLEPVLRWYPSAQIMIADRVYG